MVQRCDCTAEPSKTCQTKSMIAPPEMCLAVGIQLGEGFGVDGVDGGGGGGAGEPSHDRLPSRERA